jgi:hypothetical protein
VLRRFNLPMGRSRTRRWCSTSWWCCASWRGLVPDLGQAEDPDFTFKLMVVRTGWPGASAEEVERQLTDKIEKKLQETPRLDFLRSYSKPGESVVFVFVKDSSRPRRDPRHLVPGAQEGGRHPHDAARRASRGRPSTTSSATPSATSTRSPATASPMRS